MDQPKPDILICTDLDRTLLPNGPQAESPAARPRFHRLAEHPEVHIAYVTGRHQALVEQAIREYGIPTPDFLIGDVGTSIYRVDDGQWQLIEAWSEAIGADWAGLDHDNLAALLADLPGLRLQEPEKQGRYKLSWYTPEDWDRTRLLPRIADRLRQQGVDANLIWSLDESTGTGLLDLLPASASKRSAVEFLLESEGLDPARTLCAGDSGNDLAMLTSPLPAVLVANATDAVRTEAVELASAAGTMDQLYLAQGGFHDMNGCYAAGILEGLAHYLPETQRWWAENEHASP
jgi:hypothetical protein